MKDENIYMLNNYLDRQDEGCKLSADELNSSRYQMINEFDELDFGFMEDSFVPDTYSQEQIRAAREKVASQAKKIWG